MFGFLKNALKKTVEKITGAVSEKPREEKKPVEKEIRKEEPALKEKHEFSEKAEELIATQTPEQLETELEESAETGKPLEEVIEEFAEKPFEEKEPELKPEEPEIEPEIIKEVEKPKTKIIEEKRGLFGGLFKAVTEKKLTEEDITDFLKELKMNLIENDVAFDVAEKIGDELKKELIGKSVKRGTAEKVVAEALRVAVLSVLDQPAVSIEDVIAESQKKNEPATIIFLGFNGSGKTTNLAKLAHLLQKRGHKPVLAAADTFRAAAIEQLQIHADRLGLECIKHQYGADSAAVIFDARKHAQAVGADVVLADTAGRSHSNANLMDELKKVIRVNKPDLKILVIDGLTGNDAVQQAKLFHEAVGVDAVIVSKSDVNERGGATLSVGYTIGKPVIYLGVGQGYDDLVEFNPEEVASRLME